MAAFRLTCVFLILWHAVSFGYPQNDLGVVFIKTHKTASSTVAAMLRTNAVLFWNQSIFVPPKDHGGLQWDLNHPEHKAMILNQKSKFGKFPFRYWTSHVKYHEFINVLVPSPKVLLTVLREPVNMFISAWRYYTKIGVLRQGHSIHYILKNINERTEWNPNGMTMELSGIRSEVIGEKRRDYFEPTLENTHQLLLEAIRSRHLNCLITERLHESLGLFWNRMGWEDQYMMYRDIKPTAKKTNHRADETKIHPFFAVNETDRNLIKNASHFDQALYLEALAVLDKDMIQVGHVPKQRIQICDQYGNDEIDKLFATCRQLPLFQPSLDNKSSAKFFQSSTSVAHDEEGNHNSLVASHEGDGGFSGLFERCRCGLLGLDDSEWSEWFYHMSAYSENGSDLSDGKLSTLSSKQQQQMQPLSRSTESIQLLAPTSTCFIDQVEVSCAVNAEFAIDNMPQLNVNIDIVNGIQTVQINGLIQRDTHQYLYAKEPGFDNACNSSYDFLLKKHKQVNGVEHLSDLTLNDDRPKHGNKVSKDETCSGEVEVLMTRRGGCSFLEKAVNAQKLGFGVLVLVNTDESGSMHSACESDTSLPSSSSSSLLSPPTPSLGIHAAADSGVTIPVFMLSHCEGERILKPLSQPSTSDDDRQHVEKAQQISFKVSVSLQ